MSEQLQRRWPGAMALVLPVLAVIVLVLAYRYTAPGRRANVPSDRPVESDVLQVGALPVT